MAAEPETWQLDSVGKVEDGEKRALTEISELRKNINAYAVMAYVAVSDRNAMLERLKGLDHLNNALAEARDNLEREKDRSESLQLEVWRNEAFVTRSRLQMKTKEMEIQMLSEKLEQNQKNLETYEGRRHAEKVESDSSNDSLAQSKCKAEGSNSEGSMSTTHKEEQVKNEGTSREDRASYVMGAGSVIGVSREMHEIIVQENLHLKKTVQQLIEKQGGNIKDITDTLHLKEVIRQLKRKIGEKEKELEKVLKIIEEAEGPKEQTARRILRMERKVKDAERTTNMKHVMIEALSSRCEELARALERSQQEEHQRQLSVRSTFKSADSFKKSPVESVLPSVEIVKLTKENSKLKRLLEVQSKDNETLTKDRNAALLEKSELQQRLNNLMKLKLQPCSTCAATEAKLKIMTEKQLQNSAELEAALLQADIHKADFQEQCAEMKKQREVLNREADMWKKNFQSLSLQTDKLKKELEKQTRLTVELQAQSNFLSQHQQQKAVARYPFRHGTSFESFSMQHCGSKVNPWQESPDHASMPSEVAVGRDECDMVSPENDSNPTSRHQTLTTARTREQKRSPRKLQCIHCFREFNRDRQGEFEEHQRRCQDDS
ncbi:uncharacterized protein [Diadema antillarum]|uniref:uncharacterized protein n=1 Tax=Diadema antillarum TaxID=105358 RepID=UPI003A894697